MVTSCGRLCLYRKKINLSVCLAGQVVGIKEVDDGSLARQLHGLRSRLYRSGGKNSAAPQQSLRAKSVTYVLGKFCYPSLRAGQLKFWLPVVDAFRTFCVNPSPEGSALLSGVKNLTFLGLIGQGSVQCDSGRVSR
jgi:hypothetical protein